jgi:hypothetical protein
VRRLAACLAPALLLLAAPARAHEAGLSRGDYRIDGARLTSELVFARRELAELIPGADIDRSGDLDEFELLTIDAALRAELAAGLRVAAGATGCPGAVTRVAFYEDDGLAITARHDCPHALDVVTLRWPLLARLRTGHRHLARLVFAPTDPEAQPAEPIDLVAHARRSALTIRRPTRVAPPSPPGPAATPVAPAVPARPRVWPALATLAALALLGLLLRLRARR